MSGIRKWAKLDPASHSTLETQCTQWAFEFLKGVHKNHSPLIMKRLNSRAVKTRGKMLMSELLIGYNNSVSESERRSPAARERAGATANIIRSIIELIDSIPEDHQQELRDYSEGYYDLLFSMENHQAIQMCGAFFQTRAWKLQGRPFDSVMVETVSSCIRLLEYIVGRPFKRNFHLEKTSSGMVFTNPDCAFCEGILKLLNPSLEINEIKTAIKSQFAAARSRPVHYSGPLRKPIYGPRKPVKSG